MYRKIIIIVLAVLLVLFCVWAYRASQTSSTGNGTSKSILGSLFPFGGTTKLPPANTTTGTTPGNTTTGTGSTSPAPAKRLIQISNKLIAGFTVLPPLPTPTIPQYSITDTTGSPVPATAPLPMVRFAERGTGYIYDVDAVGNNGTKASGTVIARTAEALFADNGATVLLRYIKEDNETVSTFLGHVTPPPVNSTDDGTLKGDFLPDNIEDVAVSPDQKNILYLLPMDDGVAGISMKSDGTGKKQLFESSFSEWLLDWSSAGPIVTTKANADTPGYTYLVAGQDVLEKIIGSVDGLTTKVSPDGKYLLYSVSGGNGVDLHILRLKDGTDTNTGLQTLPEKCTWTSDMVTVYCGVTPTPPRASYPDAWYQGTIHFDDQFWKIDAADGTTTQVDNGDGNSLDATNLAVDQNNEYLFFINKDDGSLWSLNLAPVPATPSVFPSGSN